MKDFFSKNRKFFIALSVFVGVLILTVGGLVGWQLYLNKQNAGILATVGDEKITQQDLNVAVYGRNFEGTPEKPTLQLTEAEKKAAVDQLIEKKIIEIKAKELSLSASDTEITADIAATLETQKDKKDGVTVFAKYTDYQKNITKDNSRVNVLKQKVKESQLGWLKGNYLMVRFDKYNVADNSPESLPKVSSETERASLREKQKTTAAAYATELATRLNNGETFASAQLALAKHPVLGYPGVAPETPSFAGVVAQDDYYQKNFTELNSEKEFNDLAAKVAIGKTEVLPLMKKSGSQSFDYYIVYSAVAKKDGYRYGYGAWLKEQKTQLTKANKLAAVIKKVIPNAYAFTGDSCGANHKHCFDLRMYYNARDGSETPITNYDFQVRTATVLGSVDGLMINGHLTNLLSTDTGSDGWYYFSWPSGANDTPGDSQNDYINCNLASIFRIELTENSTDVVNIAGSDSAAGHWTSYINPSSGSFVLTDHLTGGDVYSRICLNNDNNGSEFCHSSQATGWGNGKSTRFVYHWYPSWTTTTNNATVRVKMNVAGGGTITNTTGSDFTGYNCQDSNFEGANCSVQKTITVASSAKLNTTPSSSAYVFKNYSIRKTSSTGVVTSRTTPDGIVLVTQDVNPGDLIEVTSNVIQTDLACSATPQNGLAPLVVAVTATGGTGGPYNFTLESGISLNGRTSPIYYTYGTAGAKTITVTDTASPTPHTCTVNITVKTPDSTNGGEVAP